MSKVIVNNKMNEFFGNLALEVGINAVRKCAEKYGFDAEEAIELCGLDSIDKHVVFNKTKNGAAKKEPTTLQLKLAKPKFPFPYCGEYKKECCQGLKYNRGLFTQCLFVKTAESDYCKRCSTQAEKNDHGKPDCGCIQDRMNIGFMDFRDPKDRAPISFVKVMRKLKISQEALLEEAGQFNIEINSIHFVEPPPPGKKGRKAAAAAAAATASTDKVTKGRPSKKKEVVVSTFTEEADLFETLTKKVAATAATATETQQQQQQQEKQTEEETKEDVFFFINDKAANQDNTSDNIPHTLSSLNLSSLICPDSSSSESSQSQSQSQSTTPTMPPPPTPPPALKTAAKESSPPAPAPEPKTTTTKPAKKMTKEEKEAAKEAEKAAKIAAKEAAKLAAKEAEKAAKLAAKEAEKAAKLAAKKSEKSEKAPKKKAEEEEAKKKAQEEEAKKKAQEEAKKKAEENSDEEDEDDDDDDDDDEEDEELAKQEEDEDEADEAGSTQLQQFKYAGKSYFKDQYDNIYDLGNGEDVDPAIIGKWNQQKRSLELTKSKIIEEDEGSDDEEKEDEYEE